MVSLQILQGYEAPLSQHVRAAAHSVSCCEREYKHALYSVKHLSHVGVPAVAAGVETQPFSAVGLSVEPSTDLVNDGDSVNSVLGVAVGAAVGRLDSHAVAK
jgi:hypothetical protein